MMPLAVQTSLGAAETSLGEPSSLEMKHGSGASNDPNLQNENALAMADPGAMAAAALRPASVVSALGQMTQDQDVGDDSLSVSEESPDAAGALGQQVPPTRKRNMKHPVVRSREVSRKRSTMSQPRTAIATSTRRGMQRPPSPALEAVPRTLQHELHSPDDASGEARLAALERQQKADHIFFNALTQNVLNMHKVTQHVHEQVKVVQRAHDEHTQMGVQLRKELYMVRDKLNDDCKAVVGAMSSGLPQLIEQQMAAAQARIEALEGQVKILAESHAKMGSYLENLHKERPAEGAVVAEAFNQVSTEVGRVRDMVNQLEHKPPAMAVPTVFQGEILTKEMVTAMRDIHYKVMNLDQVYSSYTAMYQRVEQNGTMIEALSNGCAELTQRVDTLEGNRSARLNLTAAFNSGLGAAQGHQGCGSGGCGSGNYGLDPAASAWTPGGPAHCPPPPALGMPSGSGGPGDTRMQAIIGGNGICHCVHVKELQERVHRLEASGGDPAWRAWQGPNGGSGGRGPAVPRRDEGPDARDALRAPATLPLKLQGPLGAIGYKDKALFDDKLSSQDEYRFNGSKGGWNWKGKMERYFISKAPVLRELLEWVEKDEHSGTNGEVTFERLCLAVGARMTEEQLFLVDAAIYGFLSGALTGTAETIFKRAGMLRGFDAWRKIVRFIDHGSEIRLEQLRREVKTMHLKPIKDIDSVEEGVADFENTLDEYVRAGGTPFKDIEKKSDLLAILPATLRENLLWQASDRGDFYQFRDMVLSQTQKVIMNRKRGQMNMVETEDRQSDEERPLQSIETIEDLIAAFNRLNGKGKQLGVKANKTDTSSAPLRPRKCANCGDTHAEVKCPKPPVPVSQRKCWHCNKPGHVGRNCPDKKSSPGGSMRALEDAPPQARAPFFMMDEEGFEKVRRGPKPMPRGATVSDFMSRNTFAALAGGSAPTQRRRKRDEAAVPEPRVPPAEVDNERIKHKSIIKEVTEQELDALINERILQSEALQCGDNRDGELGFFVDEPEDLIAATAEEVEIEVAIDSGAVANAVHPDELPCDARPEANTTGRHFVGANKSRIENFGTCKTVLEGEHGEVGCNWCLADVSRPLHSVSQVAGPFEGPGLQDVVFNNRIAAVLPPGIVEKILKEVKPVATYPRKGNLYVSKMKMRSFGRQGSRA